ncbi:hypothetical protein KFK09_004528 [Dendrobium nobile]|uniref:Uncharacterized protein n=1 Tax=Dendrobium nobile TaxID=94219 RepID=A0A8T3C602_DENNO|nr:hypothetical protein KFK09_004528 [Dendrobium nobile]
MSWKCWGKKKRCHIWSHYEGGERVKEWEFGGAIEFESRKGWREGRSIGHGSITLTAISRGALPSLEVVSSTGHEHAIILNERVSPMSVYLPYEDPIYNDTQRKLAIPAPRFPSGEIPNGFLGYAVNLITLDSHHSNTRTASGFGLRETLFYQLFGKLQVYNTRAEMQQASSCIDQAAVSLDGGIIVTSGIIVFGDCEPEIKFPVVPEFQGVISNSAMKILKQIEDKKAVLEAKNKEIEKKAQAHSKTLAKFHKKKEILCSLLPHL